jgi:hypothetical protein
VYVASTGKGAILELAFPSLAVLRTHQLFTAAEHLNGLAPTGEGATLWAMLHNRGEVWALSWPSPCVVFTQACMAQDP